MTNEIFLIGLIAVLCVAFLVIFVSWKARQSGDRKDRGDDKE
ncbi:MAG: hypothetical protein AAFY25_05925 [Pseudomonadota bacterium]